MSQGTLRYIVVTKDSARWFGVVLDGYAALGVSPFVILDASSGPDTEALLLHRRIEYAKESAEFPLGEALLPAIPRHLDCEWVLRLDDDELPSRGLCALVEARLPGLTNDVVGFQRRWIRLQPDGRCEYSRHPLIVSRLRALDIQWRLFRPAKVRYRSEVPHTPTDSSFPPGAGWPPIGSISPISIGSSARQPNAAQRSRGMTASRRMPVRGFATSKVWEDCDPADHRFCAMESDEFDHIAVRLAATIPGISAPPKQGSPPAEQVTRPAPDSA